MDQPSKKKLTLSKETLRSLDDDKLDDVVGGVQSEGICVGQSVVCDSVICNSGALCGGGNHGEEDEEADPAEGNTAQPGRRQARRRRRWSAVPGDLRGPERGLRQRDL